HLARLLELLHRREHLRVFEALDVRRAALTERVNEEVVDVVGLEPAQRSLDPLDELRFGCVRARMARVAAAAAELGGDVELVARDAGSLPPTTDDVLAVAVVGRRVDVGDPELERSLDHRGAREAAAAHGEIADLLPGLPERSVTPDLGLLLGAGAAALEE